jgi:hypothetical protein
MIVMNCDTCGQQYTTTQGVFDSKPMENECWTCRVLQRIDAIMDYFGVE